METVRIGIAGLGRFGKLHAATLAGLPGVEIVALCDPDASQVDAAASRYRVARGHGSLDEMLDEGGMDAVFLVTPEQYHGEQAAAVIAHGLPLFVEKPLAATADEGARIVAAANAAGVPVQLGFVVRFDAQHSLLRAEIAAGRFGQIVSIRLKRNCSRAWFPDYGDRVHTIYETSIHDIDLALWLAGSRCTRVYAVDRNYSGLTYPDACYAMLEFESGAVAMIETSWFVPQGAPANVLTGSWHGTIDAELEVIGTERSARAPARLRAGDLAGRSHAPPRDQSLAGDRRVHRWRAPGAGPALHRTCAAAGRVGHCVGRRCGRRTPHCRGDRAVRCTISPGFPCLNVPQPSGLMHTT